MKKIRVRELYQQYIGAMSEWKLKLAIARLMRYGVPRQAWQDTMQELAIVIHGFKFDEGKAHAASERTILCRRLDNRLRMLARSNARRLAMMNRLEQFNQDGLDNPAPDDSITHSEIRQQVSRLTPLQQQICQGLMNGLSVPRIARLTGRHHTTIRRHVEHLRQAFIPWEGDAWSL